MIKYIMDKITKSCIGIKFYTSQSGYIYPLNQRKIACLRTNLSPISFEIYKDYTRHYASDNVDDAIDMFIEMCKKYIDVNTILKTKIIDALNTHLFYEYIIRKNDHGYTLIPTGPKGHGRPLICINNGTAHIKYKGAIYEIWDERSGSMLFKSFISQWTKLCDEDLHSMPEEANTVDELLKIKDCVTKAIDKFCNTEDEDMTCVFCKKKGSKKTRITIEQNGKKLCVCDKCTRRQIQTALKREEQRNPLIKRKGTLSGPLRLG